MVSMQSQSPRGRRPWRQWGCMGDGGCEGSPRFTSPRGNLTIQFNLSVALPAAFLAGEKNAIFAAPGTLRRTFPLGKATPKV